MNRFALLSLTVVVACEAQPLSLAQWSHDSSPARQFTDHREAPSLLLLMPPQSGPLQLASNETLEKAYFNGRFLTARDLRDDQAQMDGAILVVSALDGPMPDQPPDRWVHARYLIRYAAIDGDVIRFAGVATLRTPAGVRSTFDVTGTLTLEQQDCRECAALIEIIGGADYDAAAGPSSWRPQVSLFDVGNDATP